MKLARFLFVIGLVSIVLAAAPAYAQQDPAVKYITQKMDAKNITVVSYNDLLGKGDGGEAMAIQQRPDGTRILFIPHRQTENCLSVVDVTHPEKPVVLKQFPSPGPGMTRCDTLGLSGNVLILGAQSTGPSANNHVIKDEVRKAPMGAWILDVSDLNKIKNAKSLKDFMFSFFDTSGPHTVGVHSVWFTDGEFAHLTTGSKDSDPTDPQDDQFYMIVDVRDPRHPREVGRWWLPGTQKGDACLPGCLPKRNSKGGENGFRPHNIEVFKERPDRAYMGYRDGGFMIIDISGLADVRSGKATKFTPKLVSRMEEVPPLIDSGHTFHPFFDRNVAAATEEGTGCGPQGARPVYLIDIRDETKPAVEETAPLPTNAMELCKHPGGGGTHNLAPDTGEATNMHLKNTFLSANTSFGLRIYRLDDQAVPFPKRSAPIIEEIGHFLPPSAPNNKPGVVDINYAMVDEKGFIYVLDGANGGTLHPKVLRRATAGLSAPAGPLCDAEAVAFEVRPDGKTPCVYAERP